MAQEPIRVTEEFIASAREAWELRVRGYRVKDIAAMLGMSEPPVTTRLKWWREVGSKQESESGESIVEYHRDLDLERIEYYISTLTDSLNPNQADTMQRDEALKLLLKLLERKARLIGEDAPVKVKVEQKTTTYRIEGVDLDALR